MGAALALLLNGRTRVHHWQSAQRLWPNTWRLQLPLDDCYRLVLPYHALQHAVDGTDPSDPPRMEAKKTTSNHSSAPQSLSWLLTSWCQPMGKGFRSLHKWFWQLKKWSQPLLKLSQPLQKWSWSLKKWSQPLHKISQPLQRWSCSLTNWCQLLKKGCRSLQLWFLPLRTLSHPLQKWARPHYNYLSYYKSNLSH